MTDRPHDVDIAVVGGGLTGLLFAALVACRPATAHLRIAVLEARPPVARDPADEPDLRQSALSPGACRPLDELGVLERLPASRRAAYRRMVVWQGAWSEKHSIRFDAAELGVPDLGLIVENEALRQALWALLAEQGHVSLCVTPPAEQLQASAAAYTLRYAEGHELRAGLLVGADGARSWVRGQLEVDFVERAYGQSGVVAHIACEQPHENTAYQRFLPDGPVALLPLADGRCSLVWSCPEEQARSLLACEADEFDAALTDAFEARLGALHCTSPRAAFPLSLGYAKRYTGKRFALVGDAAHRVHPLAGQGANLGLVDAAALADALAEHLAIPHADVGDPRMLRRYERARKGDNLVTMAAMDSFNRVFGSGLAEAAGAGLGLVDGVPALKNRFARYAMRT